MVAIFAGNGLGLFNASPKVLGPAGVHGLGALGQAGGTAFVNAANGNLVLKGFDERLSGRGTDLRHLRTYNSRGGLDDGDQDGWRWDGERRVALSGENSKPGSTVTRTDADGHLTVYAWNDPRYTSPEGSGAHDSIQFDSGPKQWVWTDGSTRLVEKYADSGRLLSQQDASGNIITYAYDASGRLAEVIDASSNQRLLLTYASFGTNTRLQKAETRALGVDTTGQPTGTLDAAVKQVEYGYDSAGRLTSVQADLTPSTIGDQATYATTYTYDGTSSRITSVSHSDGTRANFDYENERIKRVTDASGVQVFTYVQLAGGVVEANVTVDVGDGSPKLWTYVSDAKGQLVEIKTPPPAAGAARLSTRFSYDNDGNVKQIIDARSNTIDYEYDGAGNRRLERDTRGNTVVRTFDVRNQVITETRHGVPDPDGPGPQLPGAPVTNRFAYDPQARLRFAVSAEGVVVENRYATAGNGKGLLSQTVRYAGARFNVGPLTPQQALTEGELATWAGQQDKTQVELTEYTYDLRGDLSKVTAFATTNATGAGVLDAAAEVTEFVYDAHGDLLGSVARRAAGRVRRATKSTFVRDGLGRVITFVGAAGTVSTSYDDAANKVTVTTASGLAESSSFDDRGRLVGVTRSGDGTNRTTRSVYDAAGRLRMVEDALGGRRFLFYDAADRIRFTVDATGAVVGLEYNANGQEIARTSYRKLADTSGWYNAGTVTKDALTVGGAGSDVVVDALRDRVVRNDYDDTNRLATSTDAIGTASTTAYDGRSLVRQHQIGNRVSRFFYDRDDRQVGVVDPLGFLTEFRYDAAGRPAETIRYLHRIATLANASQPVWIGITNQIAFAGKQFEYRMPAYDPDGDELVYSFVGTPPSWLTLDTTSGIAILRGKPPVAITSYDVTVKADDQRAKSATASLTITVGNTPPTWTALPDSTAPKGNPEYRIVLPPATDVESAAAQLSYSMVSPLPAGLSFTATERRISGTPTTPGVYTLTARVTDHHGLSTDRSFTITVTHNGPTWAGIPNQTTFRFQSYSFPVPPATEPDGRPLVYSVVAKPAWLTFNPVTRELKGTAGDTKLETVVLRAEDPEGRAANLQFSIDVRKSPVEFNGDTNRPPTPTKTANLAAAPGDDTLADWRPADTAALRSYLYYDGQGRVVGAVDEQGFLTESAYNAETNIRQEIRYRTPVAVLSTDTLATLKAKAGTAKLISTVEFDDLGRISRTVAPDGTVTRPEYDGAGRLVREVRADGSDESRAGRIRLNAFGEETGVLRGEGDATLPANPTKAAIDAAVLARGARMDYDSLGRRTKALGPTHRTTLSFYDAENRLTHTINGALEVAETTYDANGQMASVRRYANPMLVENMLDLSGGPATQLAGKLPATDTRDQLTTYEYDRRGLLVKQTDAEGFITHRTYTQFGQLETETREISKVAGVTRSVTNRFDYDLRGGLRSQTADAGGINLSQGTSYDGQGRPIRSVDGAGKITTAAYGDGGRSMSVTDPLGRTTRSEFDLLGRVARQVDASEAETTYTYDDATRTATVTSPEEIQVSTRKTRHGEVAEVTDGSGGKTKYEYNQDGQLLKVFDETNILVRENTYDPSGRLETTTDGRGMVVRFGYDDADRVRERKVVSDNNLTTEHQFNSLGQTVTVVEGKGTIAQLVTSYTYDRMGRLKQVVVDPDGLRLLTRYDYNGLGEAVTIQRGTLETPNQQVTKFEFDNLGRKTKQIEAPSAVLGPGPASARDLTTEYRYDGAGRISRTIDADGNSSWTVYDAAGQITHLINAEGEVTHHRYDVNGRLLEARRYVNRLPAATLAGFGDIAGAVLPASDVNDQRSILSYDKDGRLRFTVTAVRDDKWAISENRYDPNGNVIETRRYDKFLLEARVTALDTAASPGLSVAEINAELTALGYGGDETLTKIQRTRFAYHANNRMRFTVDAQGAVSENVYDPMGALVATVRYAVKPVLTAYTQNAISAAVDRKNRNNRVTRFSYDSQGRLRYTLRVSANDAEGDATQHVVAEQTYDPVGRPGQTIQYTTRVGVLANYQVATIAAAVVTSSEDRRQVSVYDVAGRPIYTVRVLAAGAQGKHVVSKTDYDALGRVTQTTAYALEIGLANFAKATLDAATNTNKTAKDRTTTFVYDVLGRQRFVVAPDGALSETIYDAMSRPKERRRYHLLVDAATPRTEAALVQRRGSRALGDGTTRGERFGYDKAGRLRTTTDAKGTAEVSVYNGVGDRTSHTDRNAAVCTYVYDRLGRVRRKINPAIEVQLTGQSVQTLALEDVTSYDALGNLDSTTERANTVDSRTTDFDFDNVGRLTTTSLPGFFADPTAAGADPALVGRVYKDNAPGRFRRTVTLTYDVFGGIVRTQTKTGLTTTQSEYKTYDLLGRVVHDIDALNNVTSLSYTVFDEQESITRHSISVTGTPANGSHWTAAEIAPKLTADADSRTVTTMYDNAGRKSEVKEPSTGYFHGDRAERKNATSVTLTTDQATIGYAYNAFGQVRRESRKLDTTRWQDTWRYYDTVGRETRTVDALGQHATKAYDPFGNLTRIVEFEAPGLQGGDGLNEPGVNDGDRDRIIEFKYDVLDRRTEIRRLGAHYTQLDGDKYVDVENPRDLATAMQTFTYEPTGKVQTQKDGLGNITQLFYNALGQLTRTVEPARVYAAQNTIDPFRNASAGGVATVLLTPDAFGNVAKQSRIASTIGETLVTQHSYDAAGNFISTTDAKGNVSRRQVDYAGRVAKEIQPISVAQGGDFTYSHDLERRYFYDVTGRQTHTLDVFGDGPVRQQAGVQSLFNAFGEVTEERRVWGLASTPLSALSKAKTAVHKYDKAGHVIETTDGDGRNSFDYNIAGQVTRHEQRGQHPNTPKEQFRVTETGYDELGRPQIQRLPAFTALVSGAATLVTPLVTQDHDRWGNITVREEGRFVRNDTGVVLGQASTTRYEYNADSQLTAERLPRAMVANGLSESQVDVRHELRYDIVGRVVQEFDISSLPATPQFWQVERARSKKYDAVGQVISETDGTGVTTQYAYDAHGNRVAVRNGLGIIHFDTFDPNGNVLTQGVLRQAGGAVYDGGTGQTPVRVVFNDYRYDQANRRVGTGEAKNGDGSAMVRSLTKIDDRGFARINVNAGIRTTSEYSVLGHKIRETDANGQAHDWVYNLQPDPDVSDPLAPHIHKFGRLQSSTVGGNNTTSYNYNNFGELSGEAYTVPGVSGDSPEPRRIRTFHENGLLKRVSETLAAGAGSEDEGSWSTNDTTDYVYTPLGQLTKESFKHTGKKTIKKTVGAPPNQEVVYEQKPLPTVERITMTTYDVRGRLGTVSSTPGIPPDVDSLRRGAVELGFGYDELSNRRRVKANFTRPGSTTAEQERILFYDYDAEGRMTVVEGLGANGTVVAGRQGTTIKYDKIGRRLQAEKFVDTGQGTTAKGIGVSFAYFREEGYGYDDRNFLIAVSQRINKREYKPFVVSTPPDQIPLEESSAWTNAEIRQVDGRGALLKNDIFTAIISTGAKANEVTTTKPKATVERTYYDHGQLKDQKTTDHTGLLPDSNSHHDYDAAGVLTFHTFHQTKNPGNSSSKEFTNQYTHDYLLRFGGYKERLVTVVSSDPDLRSGETINRYDPSGRLVQQNITQPGGVIKERGLLYDVDDHVLAKDEFSTIGAAGRGAQDFTYAQGNLVAVVGSGVLKTEEFTSVFTPISASYPAPNPGSHVVSAGDSLATIAQLYFGDSSLWHLIADENNVAQSPADALPTTEEGKTYRIPNVVGNVHNTATTFMPYNLTAIIGDSTPYPR
ncbi:putative Ig domain-containing protein, partial [Kribbella albertanoniae]|uniref:putative Ig domain-containing protein n=1 Tax=Kribbella albertanoniae TaxID=1266829 RepID=UPI001EE0CEFA